MSTNKNLNKHYGHGPGASNQYLICCVILAHLQQPYEQQTSVSMPQHTGFGYNQAHFHPGHGQQAVMMRQKSIGNCKCHRNVSAQCRLLAFIPVTICTFSQV